MQATITLTEKEMSEAIMQYLESKGWAPTGTVSFSHYTGDQREPSYSTASVTVAATGKAR